MSKLNLGSLYQLTSVRFRLLFREPEAVFWIFMFPILLAGGLGIAFRNRPADVLPVAATTPQLTQALAADKGLSATHDGRGRGAHALATGTILLLAIPSPAAWPTDTTTPIPMLARRGCLPIAPCKQPPASATPFTQKTSSFMRPARAISTSSYPACWA